MKSLFLALGALFLGCGLTASAAETEPSSKVLVVVAKVKDLDANHYLWAAEIVAARLDGEYEVLEGGLAGALKFSREHPGEASGILEVLVDVHTIFEEVRVTCFDTTGRERWKRKTELNAGGSEEKMARNMLDRVINKIQKKKLRCT